MALGPYGFVALHAVRELFIELVDIRTTVLITSQVAQILHRAAHVIDRALALRNGALNVVEIFSFLARENSDACTSAARTFPLGDGRRNGKDYYGVETR
jgi:hypothetical protein